MMCRFYIHVILYVALLCCGALSALADEGMKYTQMPSTPADNPLMDDSFLIPWSQLTPDRLVRDIDEAISVSKKNLETIKREPLDCLTYANTFMAYEQATMSLERSYNRVFHLRSTMDNPKLRAALNKITPKLSEFMATITLDEDLWKVLKTASTQPWIEELAPVHRRYVDHVTKEFIRGGADLDPDSKILLLAITKELAAKTQEYSELNLDALKSWQLIIYDKEKLKGMPQNSLNLMQSNARENGFGTEKHPAWRISLQGPSASAVMQYADSMELRKQVWTQLASIGTGSFDTEPLIRQIVKLRTNLASLVGYKNFADYVTEERMAQTGENALAFVENLHQQIKDKFLKETRELLQYRNAHSPDQLDKLPPWDVPYWAEKMRKDCYNLEDAETRPYFYMDRVMAGMFKIYGDLYNVDFKARKTYCLSSGKKITSRQKKDAVEVWAENVNFYEVRDRATGEHLGSFYTDWFPRASKRSGAWAFILSAGSPPSASKERVPHLAVMCGSMTPPIGKAPSMLSHREVITIFHEFGHELHILLSNVPVPSLSGTRVPWDFVEFPSQINERWTMEKMALDIFARHYQTGKTISPELYQKILNAKNYRAASAMMGQLATAKMDLELHMHPEILNTKDIDAAIGKLLEDYQVDNGVKEFTTARNMKHIFSNSIGYASAYYSYKWAEVLAADGFNKFKEEGILNPEVGRDFRKKILGTGNSRPPEASFRDFMGRDPDPSALLKQHGISTSSKVEQKEG